MSVVLSTHSVSLDGFMAQTDGRPGRLHGWLSANGERVHRERIRLVEAPAVGHVSFRVLRG